MCIMYCVLSLSVYMHILLHLYVYSYVLKWHTLQLVMRYGDAPSKTGDLTDHIEIKRLKSERRRVTEEGDILNKATGEVRLYQSISG